MIEMRDSKSNSVLLRAADTEKAPQLDQPEDSVANSEEVLAAAEHWAQLFRNFLDANLINNAFFAVNEKAARHSELVEESILLYLLFGNS